MRTPSRRGLGPAAVLAALVLPAAATRPEPPRTRVEGVADLVHGVRVADPYRWLEDQQAPETRAWIEAQTAYTRSLLEDLPVRVELAGRLERMLRVDAVEAPPLARGGRYFYLKRPARQDLAALYARQGAEGAEQLLVDPLQLDPEGRTSVSLEDVSADGRLLVYGLRRGGEDELALRIRDVDSRRDLPDALPRARYGNPLLSPDGAALYYTLRGGDGPRLLRHRLGASPGTDSVLFGEGRGPGELISYDISDDGRRLIIAVNRGSAALQTKVYALDASQAAPAATVVDDLEASFSPVLAGERLFLRTDWRAPNGRLVEVDLARPGPAHWREVIPEGKHPLVGVVAAGGRLLVESLEDVASRLRVFGLDGARLGDVPLSPFGTVSRLTGQWGSPEAFFNFTAFDVPATVYRYRTDTGALAAWMPPSADFQGDGYVTRQEWYTSRDGTRVPMFLFHRKDLRLDGANPTVLTGYGGFNVSRTPQFSAQAAAWAARGGVWASPALRGGGEFGESWHRAGMRERKQNVFDDFIAAAEWLVANRYTRPARLAVHGGSNGGLLVGAALTQRPELFAAAVCTYPLLDMVRYHRFLAGPLWVPEYGSAEDAAQFQTLYAYSPYHHVRDGERYPAVLLVSGDADTRVAPLHARKMTARLQAATASGRPVLLRYSTLAGHARDAMPISTVVDTAAAELGFLAWQLEAGLTPAPAAPRGAAPAAPAGPGTTPGAPPR